MHFTFINQQLSSYFHQSIYHWHNILLHNTSQQCKFRDSLKMKRKQKKTQATAMSVYSHSKNQQRITSLKLTTARGSIILPPLQQLLNHHHHHSQTINPAQIPETISTLRCVPRPSVLHSAPPHAPQINRRAMRACARAKTKATLCALSPRVRPARSAQILCVARARASAQGRCLRPIMRALPLIASTHTYIERERERVVAVIVAENRERARAHAHCRAHVRHRCR